MKYPLLKQTVEKARDAVEIAAAYNRKYQQQGKSLEAYIVVKYDVMVKVKER